MKSDFGVFENLRRLNWGLIALVTLSASVGFAALYSAGGGSWEPWALKQMMRFVMGFCGMLLVAMIDVRYWYRLAWPIYALALFLLLVVDIFGHIGMGAQRWINLGFMQLQPSEVIKISLVLVLARYFHSATLEDMRRITFLLIPAGMVLVPFVLVIVQPDLGTSLKVLILGTSMFFIAGASLWLFFLGGAALAVAVPLVWTFVLHEYQKKRVYTFLDPESDPLGAGFHITQSKIALGSGGVTGKGFLQGTQSHLNFLPEKQTDFIFTLWAEEWGLIGSLALLTIFGLIFCYGFWIALRARQGFTRYLALGLIINYSLYVFINVAMVMGMIPVVGVPLPLISHGGTAMLSLLFGFGLLLSCNLHRESKVSRV